MSVAPTLMAATNASSAITRPGYDRTALTPGIVHIGLGNFHRAHQAIYLDRLFSMGNDHDWAIVGAGIKPIDAETRAKLEKQDWLTTVVELDPKGLTAHVCGSMIDFVAIDQGDLLETLAKPWVRIVSLTITEGGYFIDATTGGFQIDHPEIVADIEQPDKPTTVFGVMIAALARRRSANLPAFTIMSCDNIPGNGDVSRAAIIGLARAVSSDLAEWIENHVAFPNGMVDCITPATSGRERGLVRDIFGIEDESPVVCEPFRQWVLEDKFSAGRPSLEKVGVEFVREVAPYELMKLRILNGGHAALAYPAALLGFEFVHDAMADPSIRDYLQKLEHAEIIPTVPKIEGVDFAVYFDQVQQRFSNAAVGDTIARLCFDGSNRQPKFILPIISDRLRAGAPIPGLALEIALWCRYCCGIDEDGRDIDVNDANVRMLRVAGQSASRDPGTFLDLDFVFGTLGDDQVFRREFSMALTSIVNNGVRQSLANYVKS